MRFSIRYKILLLLTIIPVVTLAAYLYLAIAVFKDDKIAYVFDSSSAVSRTLAAQTKAEITSLLNLLKPIMQDYIDNKMFSQVSRSVFQNEIALNAMAVYRPGRQTFEYVSHLEKVDGHWRQISSEIPELGVILQGAQEEGRIIRAPFADDRMILIERVGRMDDPNRFFLLALYSAREFADVFSVPSQTKTYLISSAGEILYGPEKSPRQNLSSIVPLNFLSQAQQNKASDGTVTVNTTDGRELLVSYSKTGISDIQVVSLVDKSLALGAVEILVKKSIIFFLMLICATIIVSLISAKTLTAALTQLSSATQRVASGDFDFRVKVKSKDEVGALAESFNLMADEVARLLLVTAEKARMEGELKTAQTVQETLFPQAEGSLGGLAIAGHYEPASECGGDWWHYCEIGGKVYLWIGDATGHGVPAALITSAAKSAATIIERFSTSPAEAMELLNRAIYDVSRGKIMMTFFLAAFDPQSGDLTYANASHESPFLIKKSDKPPKKKDLIPLNEVNSPRLGQSPDTKYTETSVKLDTGDLLFLYTDGIPDVRSPSGEALGERDFIKAIVDAARDLPESKVFAERLNQKIQDFRQLSTLVDDVTFFVVRKEGST